MRRTRLGFLTLTALLCTATALPSPVVLAATSNVQAPQHGIEIGVNGGRMIRLDRPAANVFIANPKVADVQIKSPQLIYVFGVGDGETSLYAVDGAERVIYSTNIRVANNIDQIKQMLDMALPHADINVQTLNGMVFLSGTVPSPADVEQAERLVNTFTGDRTRVVNQLATAAPVQVNLRVKIAEVSRDVIKSLGVNWASEGSTFNNFLFGIAQGRSFSNLATTAVTPAATAITPQLVGLYPFLAPYSGMTLPFDPVTGQLGSAIKKSFTFTPSSDGFTSLFFRRQFGNGLDLQAAVDALEGEGFLTVLAEPNLTARSGEAASFLAGGEFAIPAPDDNGRIIIEYKEYGVGLAFVPVVMSDGRISLRVRPEVSQLFPGGGINLNGISVPGLQTRRAETTVELGSGQSFMIAGLLQNTTQQDVRRFPGLGSLPVLGALFRSDRFRRQETELVIIVTPYLVRPTDARKLITSADGYEASGDLARWLRGDTFRAQSKPGSAAPAAPSAPAAAPGIGFPK